MMTVHLYKLTSGESVIAYFRDVEVLNEIKDIRAHTVNNPMIVDLNYNLSPWVNGIVDTEKQYITNQNIMLLAEQHLIDPVLVELYVNSFPQ
jgi:hypothetical protein